MFVDTSAIVAILADEPDADLLLSALSRATRAVTAPHVRLASVMILAEKLGLEVSDANALFSDFVAEAKIDVRHITDDVGSRAVMAFARFGKGQGHPAQLNFGDCLSYACASALDAPILFKGADFSQTDLKSAV